MNYKLIVFITLSTRCARIMENRPFFRFQIYHCSDNINKRLKQIKLPVSFRTCATCFELPSNVRSMIHVVIKAKICILTCAEFKRINIVFIQMPS